MTNARSGARRTRVLAVVGSSVRRRQRSSQLFVVVALGAFAVAISKLLQQAFKMIGEKVNFFGTDILIRAGMADKFRQRRLHRSIEGLGRVYRNR